LYEMAEPFSIVPRQKWRSEVEDPRLNWIALASYCPLLIHNSHESVLAAGRIGIIDDLSGSTDATADSPCECQFARLLRAG